MGRLWYWFREPTISPRYVKLIFYMFCIQAVIDLAARLI